MRTSTRVKAKGATLTGKGRPRPVMELVLERARIKSIMAGAASSGFSDLSKLAQKGHQDKQLAKSEKLPTIGHKENSLCRIARRNFAEEVKF